MSFILVGFCVVLAAVFTLDLIYVIWEDIVK